MKKKNPENIFFSEYTEETFMIKSLRLVKFVLKLKKKNFMVYLLM